MDVGYLPRFSVNALADILMARIPARLKWYHLSEHALTAFVTIVEPSIADTMAF